jgi:hypothetical protein
MPRTGCASTAGVEFLSEPFHSKHFGDQIISALVNMAQSMHCGKENTHCAKESHTCSYSHIPIKEVENKPNRGSS